MARGNWFANYEEMFKGLSKEEIAVLAIDFRNEVVQFLQGTNFPNVVISRILLSATAIGVMGDDVLNDAEKEMIDVVLGSVWDGDIEEINRMIREGRLSDRDYELIESVIQLGNAVAMPLFCLILSFAYADGVFEDEVAERLERIFGMNLIADFLQSGLEEVPPVSHKVELTGFEAEIVQWLQSNDELEPPCIAPLKKFVEHFPGKTKAEVKKTLDGLCDKGILWGGDDYVACMYGLQ